MHTNRNSSALHFAQETDCYGNSSNNVPLGKFQKSGSETAEPCLDGLENQRPDRHSCSRSLTVGRNYNLIFRPSLRNYNLESH